MNVRIACLKAMCDRNNWSRYGTLLLGLKDQEREIRNILFTIKTYYETYPDVESISVDELKLFFQHQNPSIKDNDVYDLLFHQITTADLPNQQLLKEVLDTVIEDVAVRKASLKIIPYLNGEVNHKVIEEMQEILDDYREKVGLLVAEDDDPRVCNLSLRELLDRATQEGLRWQLGILNTIIGPLPVGYLGHIFACSNVGKSSLAISQSAFFAHQLKDTDQKVIYLNNEEEIFRIRLRFHSALLNMPIEVLLQDPDRYEAEYEAKGGKNIITVGGVATLPDVEMYLKRFKPRVAIVDQGPKLTTPGDHARHEHLLYIYNNLRELAKEYQCSIISLGQADGASEGKLYLGKQNVEGSKAGYLQGECDFMIGIGMSGDEGMEDMRYISIPKNKLKHGREGTGVCTIDRLTGRFNSA